MFVNKDYSLYNGIPRKFRFIRTKKLGDWEIAPWDLLIDDNQLIGQGEFGHVYLAKWKSTQVVAKVMNEDISADKKKLFLNEFDNLSKSHHPNIVQIFGYVEEPFIIVMEYLSQHNLLFHITKNRLSLVNRIDICLDILKGVEYLHSREPQSIIHRDLKPQNIILSASKSAKIADFGLSKLLKDKNTKDNLSLSETNMPINISNEDLTKVVGTKRYMSPELSKQLKYNQKIDIWSVGIIFSELFESKRYNTDFYWKKTPVEIQNIINQYMLREDPENRLSAREIVVLFEQTKKSYQKKNWWSCLF